jgi:hypothetical protein
LSVFWTEAKDGEGGERGGLSEDDGCMSKVVYQGRREYPIIEPQGAAGKGIYYEKEVEDACDVRCCVLLSGKLGCWRNNRRVCKGGPI